MKTLLVSLLSLSAVSATAAPVCGLVGTHIVRPHCNPHEMCPQWRRLQYDIKIDAGTQYDINALSTDVLTGFQTYSGKQACVQGQPERDGSISVSAITGR